MANGSDLRVAGFSLIDARAPIVLKIAIGAEGDCLTDDFLSKQCLQNGNCDE